MKFRLKKTTMKLSALAVVLIVGISAAFVCPIIGSANENIYGTSKDGINGNALSLVALDDLANGNFSEGLKFWGSNRGRGLTSAEAAIQKDGDNSYLEINRETGDYNAAHGVISVPFKINGLSAGDEVYFYFDYKVAMNAANVSAQNPLVASLRSVTKNSTTFASSMEFYSAAKTDIPKWTRAFVKAAVNKTTESGEDTFYVSFVVNYNVAAKVSIDNVVIAIRDNTGADATPVGYYERLDGTLVTDYDLNPNMYGTADDGVSDNALNLPALNDIANGDFSEGLKYWGSSRGRGLASTEASVQKDGENSYLEINRETGDYNAAHGVISVPFKIKGLSEGDEISLYFDHKVIMNSSNVSGQYPLVATLRSVTKDSTAFESALEIYSPAKTNIPKLTKTSAKATVSKTTENGEDTFYVSFTVNYNVAAKINIDNVIVAVRHNSGENATPQGYWERLDGTLVTENDLNPTMYGTDEDGISGNALSLRPLNDLKNGDFSEGLKYWGNDQKNGVASSRAALKNEGGNKYININRNTPDNAGKGIISVPVRINGLAVGDEIVMLLDYRVKVYDSNKAGAAFYANLKPLDNKTTEFEKGLTISANTVDVSKWTKAMAKATVKSLPESGSGIYYVSIYLQYKAAASVDIDNVVLAIKHNSGSNITPEGYYHTLDGRLVSELTLNPTMYGTAESGISGSAFYLTPLDLFKNGDFSEDLKYWAKSGANATGVASDNAYIEKNGDNKYLVIERKTPENTGKGISSTPFRIKNLQKGDVIAFMFDYKAEIYDSNIASTAFYMNFHTRNKETFKFFDGKNSMTLTNSSVLLENDYVKTQKGWSTAAAMQIVSELPADTNPAFYIEFYMQYKAAGKLSFDNFKVLVRHNSGPDRTPDGYYQTIDGKLVSDKIFKGLTVTTGSKDIDSGANDVNYPGLVYSWIGTEEDGIYSKVNELGGSFPVRTNIMNTDFSKGLQYWFDSKSTGYTSKNVRLLTEKNGNRYISLCEDGNAVQLNQTKFRLPNNKPGDELWIMTRFRGSGKVRQMAYAFNVNEGRYPVTRINDYARVLYEPESDDDWGYTISASCIYVPEKEQMNKKYSDIYGDEPYYYIMLQADAPVQYSDICFVTKNSDGTYTDTNGKIIKVPVNTNRQHTDINDGFNWGNNLLENGYGTVKVMNLIHNDSKQDVKENTGNLLLIALIVAGGALIITAGVFTTVIVKRKKKQL